MKVEPSSLKRRSCAHSAMQWMSPWPVASRRPHDPPDAIDLPVTTRMTALRSFEPTTRARVGRDERGAVGDVAVEGGALRGRECALVDVDTDPAHTGAGTGFEHVEQQRAAPA